MSPKATPTHSNQAGAAEKLTIGSHYTGTILQVNTAGSYTVRLSSGVDIHNVERVMAPFCSLMGLKDLTVLESGTPVVVAYGKTSFILGVRDTDIPGQTLGRTTGQRLMVGGEKANADIPSAADALSGEVEIANAMSVGLRFLTTVMQMTAGDRAKVECCLLNDMVRIVSAQYRHISPMGDELMFDHGRPTLEKGWTAYRHELFGLKASDDELYDESTLFADRVKKLGRNRLIEYIGFAGDMIHSFIADPSAAIFEMTGTAEPEAGSDPKTTSQYPAGKSWVHRAMDGSVIVQSVADIRLERVVRIPVPVRFKSHEDPSLNRHYDTLSEELKTYLKAWDMTNPYRMTFQLREYSRWLTRYAAFARFVSSGEYSIPKETDAVPDYNNKEDDRETVNGPLGPIDAYAVITIMRNGAIVIFGSGASVVMSNGELQMTAMRHVTVEAGGDLRLVAGGSIFLKARKHIEMVATAGSLITYAFCSMRHFCEAGSVIIKSLAKKIVDPDDEATKPKARFQTDRDKDDPDMIPQVASYALAIETPNGEMTLRSGNTLTIATDNPPTGDTSDPDLRESAIMISAAGNIRVKSNGYLVVAVARDFMLSVKRNIAITASLWYTNVLEMVFGQGGLFIRPGAGIISANSVNAFTVHAYSQIEGPEVGPLSKASGSGTPVGSHFNHILIMDEKKQIAGRPKPADDDAHTLAKNALTYCGVAFQYSPTTWTGTDGEKWGFMSKAAYQWDTIVPGQNVLTETLTQQFIRQEYESSTYDNVWLSWDWNIPTFTQSAISAPQNRIYEGYTGSFGCETYVARQEEDAAWPSLLVPSDKSMEDMNTWLKSHKVDDNWSSTSYFTMKTYRPAPAT